MKHVHHFILWLMSYSMCWLLSHLLLLQAFHLFDLNNDGFIDKEDLRNTYITLGKTDIDDNEIQCMLSEVRWVVITVFMINKQYNSQNVAFKHNLVTE